MPKPVDSVELFEGVVCIGLSKNYDHMRRRERGRKRERRERGREGGREERREKKSVHKFSSSQATGPSTHLPAPT